MPTQALQSTIHPCPLPCESHSSIVPARAQQKNSILSCLYLFSLAFVSDLCFSLAPRPAFEQWSDFWDFDSRFNDAMLTMPGSERVSRRSLFIYRVVVLIFFVVCLCSSKNNFLVLLVLALSCGSLLFFFLILCLIILFIASLASPGQFHWRSNLQ